MMDDETEVSFEVMDLDELDDWVTQFITEAEGDDRDAVCTMTMALEQMHAFITSTDSMTNRYKTFIRKGGYMHTVSSEVLH